jgi:hypothetical protein
MLRHGRRELDLDAPDEELEGGADGPALTY